MPDTAEPAAPLALGRRQQNILTGLLRGVPVLGHGDHFEPLTDAGIRRTLLTMPPLTMRVAGESNRLRPRVVDAVIGPAARRTGYVHGLPPHGLQPLLRAAGAAAHEPLILRVVYGASTRVPLRALSYVLPAVHTAARLSVAGYRSCHIQVVLAGAIGSQINTLDAATVHAETSLLAEALIKILTHLAPSAFSVYGAQWTKETQGLAGTLLDALTPHRRTAVLARLNGKGSPSRPQNTLLYAAAHTLLHDRDLVPLTLIHGTVTPQSSARIDMGGLQERHFHAVRRELTEGDCTDGPGALVLTRHFVPPYTMARDGDIALRDYLDSPHRDSEPRDRSARHDLRHLWTHLPPPTLREVLNSAEHRAFKTSGPVI
ncbi:hypothetical protein [Streptomyces griseoaurantiacus]|uniref:hypothetical protein n=1 Tax=Streptomyces griseoaurantiacus TaxID=68213 RepID=UPI00352FCA24